MVDGGLSQYTDPGSWALLADLVDQGEPIYETLLEKPPGMAGLVVFRPPTATWHGIYIKFELISPGIHGRSFHAPIHPTLIIVEKPK
jgi:hypothetical protein